MFVKIPTDSEELHTLAVPALMDVVLAVVIKVVGGVIVLMTLLAVAAMISVVAALFDVARVVI